MSESSAQPGEIIAERYRVVRALGEGGMGVVVEARHIELETPVAIKFLRPEMLGNQELVRRFSREARAAVRIKSEHVARVSDVGTLPSGSPYMVMEFLEGKDLSALIHPKRPLAVSRVVDFVLQASEAIAEAHKLGIVHRDLKPSNLFLTPRADGSDLIKVLDFGISKQTDAGAESAALTGTSAMLGSPSYMSPEQLASSRDVDARTDIWALGVILYQLLTARVPFVADTIPELFMTILHQPPPALSGLRADLPGGLEGVIARCLEKKREQRYQSVAQLSRDLLPFAPTSSALSVERICRLLGNEALGLQSTAVAVPGAKPSAVIPMPSPDSRFPLPARAQDKPSASQAAVAGDAATSGSAERSGEAKIRTSTQRAWGQTTAASRVARGRRTAVLLGVAGSLLAAGGYWYSRPAVTVQDGVTAGSATEAPAAAVQTVSPGRVAPSASVADKGPAIRVLQSERAGLRVQPEPIQPIQPEPADTATANSPREAKPLRAVSEQRVDDKSPVAERQREAESAPGIDNTHSSSKHTAGTAVPPGTARNRPSVARPVAASATTTRPQGPRSVPKPVAKPPASDNKPTHGKPKLDDFGWEESRH